jgi:hypothetical protein
MKPSTRELIEIFRWLRLERDLGEKQARKQFADSQRRRRKRWGKRYTPDFVQIAKDVLGFGQIKS